ncbi:glycosyltransferase family 4 protein [Desertivirga xinjiangensis]|uniref:glycosyltransferase family 4 protein n=1 Tax=Desertivirga xinjiangensis TaxID=539206 RepID=UPI00210B7D3B|nr:glycosyltransferase family 4 protein [Pedobacter xinjiangensis]
MEPKKRKVLIACDSSRSLLDFRGKLIEALLINNDVAVFTPTITHAHIRDKLKSLGVGIYENDLNSSNVSIWSDLKYITNLYRTIKVNKPDVFFPYAFKPVIYGSMVAKMCKVKSITPMLTGLGYNFLNTGSKKYLIKSITRQLLKASLTTKNRIKVILQNKDDYDTLLNSKIINARNKAFIVNGSGVDLSHYRYVKPNTSCINFLMVSRLINAKGVNEFCEAAKQLKGKYPQVRFTLIGHYDDNIDAISKELYSQLKSGEVVEYVEPVTDIRPYIQESSVVVLPSYYGEGIPRCVLEAMAMGRAIITSDSVGCKETVNPSLNDINGYLVPVKDARALASKMEHFITNKVDIIQFGLNGRKYAEERFDVHKVNAQMLQVLEG